MPSRYKISVTPPGVTFCIDSAILKGHISAFVEGSGLKIGAVMWPLRIALSMQKVTPGGVTEILYLLGKEISLARLNDALKNLITDK